MTQQDCGVHGSGGDTHANLPPFHRCPRPGARSRERPGATYVTSYRVDAFGEQPTDILVLDDSSTVVTTLAVFDGDVHSSLLLVDRFGQVMWHQTYEYASFEAFQAITVASDGTLVAAGSSNSMPWIAKIDASDGQVIWSREFALSGVFNAVLEDTTGRLVAVGDDNQDVYVIDLDTDGTVLGSFTFGWSDSSEEMNDAVATADGGLAVAGRTTRQNSPTLTHLMAFELDRNRDVVWSSILGESGQATGREVSIDRTASGDFYLMSGNNSGGAFNLNPWVLRLSPDGLVIWSALYDQGTDFGRDVHATEDGGCVLVGRWRSASASDDEVLLLKLDPEGNIDFEHTLLAPSGTARGWSIDVTPLGGLLIAADLEHELLANRTSLWLMRLDPEENDETACGPLFHGHTSVNFYPVTNVRDQPPRALLSPTAVDAPVQVAAVQATVHAECQSCSGNHFAYGTGLAGSGNIVPQLFGVKGSCNGTVPRTVSLTSALGGTTALLLISLADADLNLFGGSLLVDPVGWQIITLSVQGTPGVPGAGSLDLVGTNDVSNLLGTPLYLQFLVLDPAAPSGVAFSNGLRFVVGN